MLDKLKAKKALSFLMSFLLVFSIMSGLNIKVQAADYNWHDNWRYKTSENGEWQYPAANQDILSTDLYNGSGFYWIDFYGNERSDFGMTTTHPGCEIGPGSTMIITNSNPSAGVPKFWNSFTTDNLFQVRNGVFIIGEGIELEKNNGKSALSLENADSVCYIAGKVTKNWALANGVWANSAAKFHRLGRDNPTTNANKMQIFDYYKMDVNAGDHIASVDEGDYLFKGRAFEPYLAGGAHFYLAGADHTVDCTAETGYHFTNWSGSMTSTTKAATVNFTGFDSRTITANAAINTYTVSFVNDVTGETLKTQTVEHGAAATAPTPAPVLAVDTDNANHRVFSGWSCAFDNVTGPLTVTAQYANEAHDFDAYGNCDCGYVYTAQANYAAVDAAIAAVPTRLVYYTDASVTALRNAVAAVQRGYYVGRQADVNAMAAAINTAIANLDPVPHTVTVPSGCTVSQTYNKSQSIYYRMAVVEAPKTSGGQFFTYWADASGKPISTYLKYAFFVTEDVSLHPVYGENRDDVLYLSRVTDIRPNDDATYSILVDHSVASTESIIGHGVIVTLNGTVGNDADQMKLGNDSVMKLQAAMYATTRTGLLEVPVDFAAGTSTIYTRSYIIEEGNKVHYGDLQPIAVRGNVFSSDAAAEEIEMPAMMLESVTTQAAEEAPVVTDDTPEAPASWVTVLTEMLTTIVQRIVTYVKFALSILR